MAIGFLYFFSIPPVFCWMQANGYTAPWLDGYAEPYFWMARSAKGTALEEPLNDYYNWCFRRAGKSK
jgi:hypothetical protein